MGKKLKFVNVWLELDTGEKIQLKDLPLSDYERFLNDMNDMRTANIQIMKNNLEKK